MMYHRGFSCNPRKCWQSEGIEFHPSDSGVYFYNPDLPYGLFTIGLAEPSGELCFIRVVIVREHEISPNWSA